MEITLNTESGFQITADVETRSTGFSGIGFYDGSNPNPNATSCSITNISIQSDNKIIVAGIFTSFNGIARNNIARLNADGTLDSSFVLPNYPFNTSGNYYINKMLLLPTGKILISGLAYNSTYNAGLVRLNNNGSIDSTFFRDTLI
jgi:uncharacterized delta-60 repeat protein